MTEQNNRGSRRVYLDFVGCRLNQAEIERMGRQFVARGDVLTDSPAAADLVVVNTCAVTNTAARRSRQLIRQEGRTHARGEIVATGCDAEHSPEKLASLPGVAHVVGNMPDAHPVAPRRGGDTGPPPH